MHTFDFQATTNNPGGDMQTLQTRSQTADKWYLEQHVVGVTLKLPSIDALPCVNTLPEDC